MNVGGQEADVHWARGFHLLLCIALFISHYAACFGTLPVYRHVWRWDPSFQLL